MNPPEARLTYRPELDGIRGIAILLVLAGHLYIEPSGRLGVALFFVLSGFLITSLLQSEEARTGTISLRRFYIRRARRLLPALFALVVVTAGVLWGLGRSAEIPLDSAAALFYFADVVGAVGLGLGLLGHTWSLAVEEQFYLVWPASLRRLGRAKVAIACWVILIVVVVVRWLLPELRTTPAESFLRVDALAAGCLLGLFRPKIPRGAVPLGWIGLAMLFVGRFPEPLELTAITIIGPILVGGAAPGVLAWRPLVRIGEISYGLYLWHFIPAVFLKPLTITGNVAAMAAVLVISIGLALVSERWIERPWRMPRGGAQAPESHRRSTARALLSRPGLLLASPGRSRRPPP
jgi:peptidoglycan/LPS O-acetylase OafA/YrhL